LKYFTLKNLSCLVYLQEMSDIHTRLKEIRTHFGLTIREFSQKIHFSHSLYGQVEYGNREPNDRIIELISSQFKVSKEWIKNGTGEMFSESPPDLRLEKILEVYNTVNDVLKDSLLDCSKMLLKIHHKRNGGG